MLIPHGQAVMDGLMDGLESRMGALQSRLQGITRAISGAVSPAAAGYDLTGSRGAAGAGGGGHALAGAGGGDIVVHNVIQLDGRTLHASVSRHAVQSQRRTGQTGMVKRSR